ncbi:conjugative transfer system coupling protein TraD (plasmid) [Polaromonas sp. P1-6]|nr:conjugative transfer system coupling protein TraD [Polaromonas sp. P1-6]
MRSECKRAGRKFLYFDAARPSESIRINPLANWNSLSEPATRIGQLVDADGSFAAFAWKTLVRVQRGLVAAGEKPNIKNTKYYVQMGVEGLCERVLALHLAQKHGSEWDRDIKNAPAGGAGGKGPLTRLDMMIAQYIKEGDQVDAIDGLVAMIKHSKEHFSKMIQVLEPILEMLGSDEIGDLLSPDASDMNDKRPIYNMRQIIDEKAVLYVGLDSLSNGIIASAVGSILLADIASCLGSIYNFSKPADAYLVVDEAAEVANAQLTQVLNKGGGAGMRVFLAMQAIADLNVRLQTKDRAEQVLANLNNLISLRVKSFETAKYVSDMFSQVSTRQMEVGFSTGSESSSAFTEFRSNVSRNLRATDSALVSPSLLMRLPPLHYFAFIAGRSYYKGALPFINGY